MPFDPFAVEAFQACSLGFAFAGVLASGFETITERKASFRLLQTGDLAALASVPILVFCAPFVLMRTTIRRRFERRPLHLVVPAMTVACLWSLMSGRLVLDAAQALAGS